MSLSIHLKRHEYLPGETVEGTVTWSDTEGADSVAISLLWFTEGKGTEDTAVVKHRRVSSPARNGSSRFTFRLPTFPWSASGKLVSIVWAVEASLDPEGDVALERLVSAPDRQEHRIGDVGDGDG